MAKREPKKFILRRGVEVVVKKSFYDGLWNVWHEDIGMKWAGPFKTQREAVERVEREME